MIRKLVSFGVAALVVTTPAALARPMGVAKGKLAKPEVNLRLQTARGPVYVFRAAGVRPVVTVVYVHGYYNDVDSAWKQHDLAAKFADSGMPAVFVVPEAPSAPQAPVVWDDLTQLLAAVRAAKPKLLPPRAPVVAVGHSAAYRTMVKWLGHPQLREVVLVDALYGCEDQYAQWLKGQPNHRMVMIVRSTSAWARPFAKRFRFARQLPEIPASPPARLRSLRLVVAQSQHGHMELVTQPQVLTSILQMSRYAAPRFAGRL